MTKIIFAIIISFLILAQSISRTVIAINFNIHQKEISQKCENKNKPMMHCNGHCQLKKELDNQEKKEQNTPLGSVKDKTELLYFYETTNLNIFSLSEITNRYFSFAQQATVDFANSVFHPPSC